MHSSPEGQENGSIVKIPYLRLGITAMVLLVLVVFVFFHFAEAKELWRLLDKANLWWILAAAGLQILTYVANGAVWYVVTRDTHRFRMSSLAVVSIEQLTVDQILPAGGLAGNTFVLQSMRRLGAPSHLATEVVLVDILAYHISYTIMMAITAAILWLRHGVTPIASTILSIAFLISVGVTLSIIFILYKKVTSLPEWVQKRNFIRRTMEVFSKLSPERVFSKDILIQASALRISIFILDVFTLWFIFTSLGVPVAWSVAFVAFILGTVAGTVSFLPGGVGGFEVACTATLILFHVPAEAALAATMITRGLTLWLPLVPGIYFAHKDLSLRTS